MREKQGMQVVMNHSLWSDSMLFRREWRNGHEDNEENIIYAVDGIFNERRDSSDSGSSSG